MLCKRYHKSIVQHVNASKSIHPFIQQVIDGAIEDVKGCLTSRCLHKSLPFPFSLNEASCVQWNDLGQLILSQTHSNVCQAWPPRRIISGKGITQMHFVGLELNWKLEEELPAHTGLQKEMRKSSSLHCPSLPLFGFRPEVATNYCRNSLYSFLCWI